MSLITRFEEGIEAVEEEEVFSLLFTSWLIISATVKEPELLEFAIVSCLTFPILVSSLSFVEVDWKCTSGEVVEVELCSCTNFER